MFSTIINLLQIFLWLRLFLSLLYDPSIYIFKQTIFLSLIDILLVLIKISKGNLLITTMQVSSRLLITFCFVEEMNIYSNSLAIVWALSEFVRYPYYIFPNSKILKWLRYNSFIILYPIGMFLEAVHIYFNNIPYTNILILLYPLFGPKMYLHMLNQRNKKLN